MEISTRIITLDSEMAETLSKNSSNNSLISKITVIPPWCLITNNHLRRTKVFDKNSIVLILFMQAIKRLHIL